MGIPEGTLYTDNTRNAGEIAEYFPAEYIDTHVAEGTIKFGRAIVAGSESGKAALPSSGSDIMLGVAGGSSQASDLDNEQYLDGDPLANVRKGIVMAYVEEAVTPESPVRIRHSEDVSAGYQEWGFASAKTGASASGLANDTTTYGAIVTVDGTAKELSVVGSAAQTLAALIAELNSDLGSAAAAAMVDGKLRITSASTGDGSDVSITDGNDSTDAGLFATLTDANASADDAVPGSGDVDPDLEPGNFCTSAIAGKTALVSGAAYKGSTTGAGLVVVMLEGPFALTADE